MCQARSVAYLPCILCWFRLRLITRPSAFASNVVKITSQNVTRFEVSQTLVDARKYYEFVCSLNNEWKPLTLNLPSESIFYIHLPVLENHYGYTYLKFKIDRLLLFQDYHLNNIFTYSENF